MSGSRNNRYTAENDAPELQLARIERSSAQAAPDARGTASAHERMIEWLRRALEDEREEHRRTIMELQNMRRALRLTEAKLGTAHERERGLTH